MTTGWFLKNYSHHRLSAQSETNYTVVAQMSLYQK